MRLVSLLLASCLLRLAHAQAQTELLGKLVKGDDQSRTPVDNVSVSLDEDGSHDLTIDGGLFHLSLPSYLKPGVEVTITVKMDGFAIYEPPGGKLKIPKDLIHREEIQMLPKGTPKFLSDTQLRAFIERTAKESSRVVTESKAKEPPDLSRYLKDWAVQNGFGIDQVQAEVNRWAADVEAKKSNNYDLSLAAFAKRNFSEAHDRAMDAAAEEEGRLAALQKQQQDSADLIIRDYRLAGDSAYNALDFGAASDAYKKGLTHASSRANGTQWANLQLILGNAEAELSLRSEGPAIATHGKSAQNAYQAALTVYTREQQPQDWAATQNSLGIELEDLAERSEGAQISQYLRQAVDAFESALQVRTREQLPDDWALTQDNLGAALLDFAERSEGIQASKYLRQAVESFESALQVFTRERLPRDWAMTNHNLGNALSGLARHSEGAQASRYLEQAVAAYESALQVRTSQQHPEDWAQTQNSLGSAHLDLAKVSDDLWASYDVLKAVDAFRSALHVYTRERMPRAWAMTQNNLGVALMDLADLTVQPPASQDLGEAVNAFRSALQVYTRQQLRREWAMTQANLGSALVYLAKVNDGAQAFQYLQEAVNAFRNALQVYTESAFAAEWKASTGGLAITYEAENDWASAHNCYEELLSHDPTNKGLQAKVKKLSQKR